MQHMPDKDFDNLFRDKFMDAEIEPSANLWAKIETQLEPKRKRILPVYWMAAASVAVAFTALLVFQKTDKIQLRPDETTTASTQTVLPTVEESSTSPVVEKLSRESDFVSAKVSTLKAVSYTATTSENNEEALQPTVTTERLAIKQADAKPIDVLAITPVENPIVIAQVDPQRQVETAVIDDSDNVQERKGIRNVGDLVNYVVDRVDKRDKKLVRFNTDDDDNSSIIGINIGFLKFNKKNK
jgi:hypothetical protein